MFRRGKFNEFVIVQSTTMIQTGELELEFTIEGNPDYGHLTVSLRSGETFIAEGGAMAWMSDGMGVKARLLGGFLPALVRKLVGGESLFVGEFSHSGGGQATFSPAVPGEVGHKKLSGDSLILTGGSFMACTSGISLKTRFGGLKSMFSGEGAFFIECSGEGDLFFNTFGALIEQEVDGSFTVDTGHVVAWEPSLDYSIRGMGGLKSTLLSGEGLAMRFTGNGKLYLQTRTMDSLANWLIPFG
jgi:uncharacterized protein (TIGR00266 family)